ncbi:MAG: FAD-binding protein [Bacteroidales bacterium]|nr:FAD-binding protein [Bacteroidales bacterium]
MFEALATKVVDAKIPILDNYQVVKLLVDAKGETTRIVGAIALNLDASAQAEYLVIQADNVIMATGGPGGLYESSVYPHGQNGAMGLALDIGAKACNLTESQFGIASIKFRWNLSGSYQQVIPRYFSVDQDGAEYEFLSDYYTDPADLIEAIFLKGYQWPFDVMKIANGGSSVIDLLVYREKYQYKRRVFIDYRQNPLSKLGKEIDILSGGEKVLKYLENSGAIASTPVLRLEQMNKPAVDLYRSKGIDLHKEVLEIDVCAQHCNGGLQGSIWWESNVQNLYPIGEANGSHGVYRPGGSALNAGQVGGIRAAQKISLEKGRFKLKRTLFIDKVLRQIGDFIAMGTDADYTFSIEEIDRELLQIQRRMSKYAAFIRSQNDIEKAMEEAVEQYKQVSALKVPADTRLASKIFRLREHAISQVCFIKAIKTHIAEGGESRGSYLVVRDSGEKALPWHDMQLFYELEDSSSFTYNNQLLLSFDNGQVNTEWQAVRPVPEETEWFEKLWKEFRGRG